MDENKVVNSEVNDNLESSKTKAISEDTKKEIEKKKSTFRLFWLFVGISIILFIWIIYLVIDIFIKVASN
ncbi:MAG: hypothetical protein IAC58_00575 [Firmicutes bacterium]|uniref:Uncharacterized protein n=1 Tax=Candidatus Onthovivens merdipullorum TaxID=2840889 RepID=A0A9D9DGA7_9BACL|nr:hypothetical protein [Candidatus Onthovivens merdipullorum]